MSSGAAVVIGAGPGLGMSIAHRFGREGYPVELVSRTATRHGRYLDELAEDGITAARAHAADAGDRDAMRAVLDDIAGRHGGVSVLYYGPAAIDPSQLPVPITETGSDGIRALMDTMYPAIDLARAVLPGMIERGDGGLLFAGGLSAVVPMPALGSLAVMSGALRNYVLTLNAGLAEYGVYAGTLTIGGLIERGDIHAYATAQPEMFGGITPSTLDPDDIAETAWQMYTERDRPETVFDVVTQS